MTYSISPLLLPIPAASGGISVDVTLSGAQVNALAANVAALGEIPTQAISISPLLLPIASYQVAVIGSVDVDVTLTGAQARFQAQAMLGAHSTVYPHDSVLATRRSPGLIVVGVGA